MSTNYLVKVDDSSEFTFTKKDIASANIIPLGKSKFHSIHNNESLDAEIVSSDFNEKTYKVKIDSTIYDIKIFNDLDVLIKKLGFEVGSSKLINEIKSPMPGLILDVMVKVGQEVAEDEPLLILEAMKMENILMSPRNGKIKSVTSKKGDAVEKNQLLITFE